MFSVNVWKRKYIWWIWVRKVVCSRSGEWRQCLQQTNNLDGCASLFTPNRIQQFQRIQQSNPNSIRHSNTLVSYYILLWCYLHSLAKCCVVMLAVGASHGLLRSSYTKAFSRSAESLSKTFKSFPSATDSYVLLAELHYNILACFI